jgi:hypothetical protein
MQYREGGQGEGGNYRQDRDQQYRPQSDSEGSQRHYEERPRVRTFDDRRNENGNGRGDGDHQPKGEHVPVTPVQIEFPQPVMADPQPANDVQAEAPAPAVRRGRPRRPKVEAAEPAEG